jgi:hypothetical protein
MLLPVPSGIRDALADSEIFPAERARSISPQKSSPAGTPPPPSHRHNPSTLVDGFSLNSIPVLDKPGSPQLPAMGSADITTSPSRDFDLPDFEPTRSSVTPPSSGLPTRTPTLSWQRRPPSQVSDKPKGRPLSIVATENAAARSANTSPERPDSGASREQIAQALSSKDPAWFRQTADRGLNSAAYRKNQVEDEDRLDMSSMSTQLPGMSRGMPSESEAAAAGSHVRSNSSLSMGTVPRFDHSNHSSESTSQDNRNPMSPPSGRTSPIRPVSPTKGMGGFVQSAMMKRTDSVKRWSVNSPAGLQRADSVASGRASLENTYLNGTHPTSTSRPGSRSKESLSRPTSSHAEEASTLLEDVKTAEEPKKEASNEERITPPTSPSKTMDPRRWSPTKSSSWLEAALNKPESPKPKAIPPPTSQPAWMVELNKAKAQKAGSQTTDLDRAPSVTRKHEVKTGGLLRSSPMGSTVKPSGLGGYPSTSSTVATDRAPRTPLRGSLSKSISADEVGQGDGESADGSLSAKSKPATPPRKDSRPGSRPGTGSAPSVGSSDFQNVFGNLRKAQTKNYVAPDTFKDNIMRGKAALNITGGPKPREKKDELKDAILQKKAEFKQAKSEGRGIATNSHAPLDKPVPEGLAKRMEMNKSGTGLLPQSPRATIAGLSKPDSGRSSITSPAPKKDSADAPTAIASKEPLASTHSSAREKASPGRVQQVGGGSIASRFNPALAGLLARGPPAMASGPSRDAEASRTEQLSAPGPQLTHMTKNRARGPKRKAPSSAPKNVDEAKEITTTPGPDTSVHRSLREETSPERQDQPSLVSLVDSSRRYGHKPQQPSGDAVSLVDSATKRSPEKLSTTSGNVISLIDSSRSTTRPRSPTKIHEQVAAIAARGQQQASSPIGNNTEEVDSQPSSPRKLDMKRMSRFMDESQSVANEPPRPLSPSKTGGRALPEPRQLSPQRTGGRPLPESPKKSTSKADVDSEPVVTVRNGAAMFGVSSGGPRPDAFANKPVFETPRPRSPIKVAGPTSPPLSSPMRSPTRYASEVSALFHDFFGNETRRREYRADAADVLMRRPNVPSRVKTQSSQLYRVSGDGKKQPVPSHQERVLFEREMYLCAHNFTTEQGKKLSEVYFWAGDEVPEATVEDSQVFLNREARALGGKLVRLSQGKETSEFLQALGGIVITRRGSSLKHDSLAPNMLCGRRYLGQIVFDEVDFTAKSLCSGFPYLVTQQGKCYLWKGKGSDVDELSCARLVGMDLALMGELVEVEEGSETDAFWAVFRDESKPGSADHWRLKPNYEKYCGRLFCSDADHPQQVRGRTQFPFSSTWHTNVSYLHVGPLQITEVHPFNQTDLIPSNIYVLDAFFEMYIIVGYGAQPQYAAFRNALDFAQEYAILAAGMEDRPFVPISTVVLEGIPRDLKSVFRKWRDALSPTRVNASNNPGSPNLKRGRSLRIVPLTQALQALAE